MSAAEKVLVASLAVNVKLSVASLEVAPSETAVDPFVAVIAMVGKVASSIPLYNLAISSSVKARFQSANASISPEWYLFGEQLDLAKPNLLFPYCVPQLPSSP